MYYKDGLDDIVRKLHELNVELYSTGGTFNFIDELNIPVKKVEDLTSYPSILGGRVKTLHPKVFGGILSRRENKSDKEELNSFEIPEIDLVIVNLYPFKETVEKSENENKIIEKIDIGGISLIRAAAKNFNDVLVASSFDDYKELLDLLISNNGNCSLDDRKYFAAKAFNISSDYDTAIFNYFNKDLQINSFKKSLTEHKQLRYGENPNQKGYYFGHLEKVFTQLHGKEISYNNLLDLDAGINLIRDFTKTTFAILKHNNACGLASRNKLTEAWKDALASDPVSAFGGVLVTNQKLDIETANEVNSLFFEIILAPSYEKEALEVLKSKKNRIILQSKSYDFPDQLFRSALNGVLVQERDGIVEESSDFKNVTERKPEDQEIVDLLFGNIIVKHTKSNAIVLAKNEQLIASGVGQTSRVDALKQAIEKAAYFGFDLNGVIMASDAFFPFADSVEIAHKAGIKAVIQPGGSVRDQLSIDYCNKNNMSMIFTGNRHFKH